MLSNGHSHALESNFQFHFSHPQCNELKQLITFQNNRIQFNENVARETFANQKYQDKKISLVSVMGPSRSGKSFLMSILTGGRQGNTVKGAFQSGFERCTEGILVFTQPMISEDGDHVIFFLDTQGTFDLQTERNISAWIAGFSLLISDVQLVNLRGNIGGDNLHDLHLFVETAAACQKAEISKSLLFVIRDASNWEQNDFLESLWEQCEKSRDLKEISQSLRSRFASQIDCICSAPVSDRIRKATGEVKLLDEDKGFISCLDKVVRLVHQKATQHYRSHSNYIDLAKRITFYLENEAPRLESTVKMTKEASITVAVNKAAEVFQKALKSTTDGSFHSDEITGREGVETKLKELLKENSIPEAQSQLEPKIQLILQEKRQQLELLANEKAFRENIDQFAKKWRSEISKLHDLDKALILRRNASIRNIANAVSIPEKTIISLEEMLDSRIIILKAGYIEEKIRSTRNELAQQLREANFQSLPTQRDLEGMVKDRLEDLRKDCTDHEITEEEWKAVEKKCKEALMEVSNKSLEVIEKVIELNKEMQRVNEMNMQATINDAVEGFRDSIKNANEEKLKRIIETSKLQAITKIKETLVSETSEKAIESFNLKAKIIIDQKQKVLDKEKRAREDKENQRLQKELEERNKHEKPKSPMNSTSKSIVNDPLPVASTSSSMLVKVMPNGNSNGPLRVEPSKSSHEISSVSSKRKLDHQPTYKFPLDPAKRDSLEESNKDDPSPSITLPEKELISKLAVFQASCKQSSDATLLFHLRADLRQEYKYYLEVIKSSTTEEDVNLFVNTLGHECDQLLAQHGIEEDYKTIRKDNINDSIDARPISNSAKLELKVFRKEWKNGKFGHSNEINDQDLKKEFHKTLTQKFDKTNFQIESILELINETSELPGKLLTPLRIYDRENKLEDYLATIWIDVLRNSLKSLSDKDQRTILLRLRQRLPKVHQQIVGSLPSPSSIYKQTIFASFIIGIFLFWIFMRQGSSPDHLNNLVWSHHQICRRQNLIFNSKNSLPLPIDLTSMAISYKDRLRSGREKSASTWRHRFTKVYNKTIQQNHIFTLKFGNLTEIIWRNKVRIEVLRNFKYLIRRLNLLKSWSVYHDQMRDGIGIYSDRYRYNLRLANETQKFDRNFTICKKFKMESESGWQEIKEFCIERKGSLLYREIFRYFNKRQQNLLNRIKLAEKMYSHKMRQLRVCRIPVVVNETVNLQFFRIKDAISKNPNDNLKMKDPENDSAKSTSAGNNLSILPFIYPILSLIHPIFAFKELEANFFGTTDREEKLENELDIEGKLSDQTKGTVMKTGTDSDFPKNVEPLELQASNDDGLRSDQILPEVKTGQPLVGDIPHNPPVVQSGQARQEVALPPNSRLQNSARVLKNNDNVKPSIQNTVPAVEQIPKTRPRVPNRQSKQTQSHLTNSIETVASSKKLESNGKAVLLPGQGHRRFTGPINGKPMPKNSRQESGASTKKQKQKLKGS